MIKNIAVIGAGIMGHGIAEAFAIYGYPVHLYEMNDAVREQAKSVIGEELEFLREEGLVLPETVDMAMNGIVTFSDLKAAVADADYIIEAIPDDVIMKQELLDQLHQMCKPEAIFGTNTSSLALKDIMARLPEQRRARTIVCHWYNPAHLIPIVELSFFGNMEKAVYKEVEELYLSIGKQPVKVNKDVPGLVANRIQCAFTREALSLVDEGVVDPEDMDRAVQFGPGFRFATTGLLEIMDMGGIDTWCRSCNRIYGTLNNTDKSNSIMQKKADEGKTGMKAGEGFFSYDGDAAVIRKKEFNKRLIAQLKTTNTYLK